jgi:hypothetical protein
MTTPYIDLLGNSGDRKSHLYATSDGRLEVVGSLPHGYKLEPATKQDAEKLISYLQNWIAAH